MAAATVRRARTRSDAPVSHSPPGGLIGDVAKFLVTRSLLTRVARVGGLQGMVLSAVATYALDRYLMKRRR